MGQLKAFQNFYGFGKGAIALFASEAFQNEVPKMALEALFFSDFN